MRETKASFFFFPLILATHHHHHHQQKPYCWQFGCCRDQSLQPLANTVKRTASPPVYVFVCVCVCVCVCVYVCVLCVFCVCFVCSVEQKEAESRGKKKENLQTYKHNECLTAQVRDSNQSGSSKTNVHRWDRNLHNIL